MVDRSLRMARSRRHEAFGGVQLGGNFNNNQNESAPIMFYSRRIGLVEGQQIPIIGGGRLTGRIGQYSLGVLNTTGIGLGSLRV